MRQYVSVKINIWFLLGHDSIPVGKYDQRYSYGLSVSDTNDKYLMRPFEGA